MKPKSHNVKSYAASFLVAALCVIPVAASCAEPDTVGLWLFNGADGASVPDVIPNLVEGSPVQLQTVIVNPNGWRNTDLPKYSTQDVPAPYIFSDASYAELIAEPSAVAVMQSGCTGASPANSWRSASLVVTNLADALEGDWTIEVIAKIDFDRANTWSHMISLETVSNTVVEGVSGLSGFFDLNSWFVQNANASATGLRQVGDSNRRCWPAFSAFGEKTQIHGLWGHYAMRYSKADDTFYTYGNGADVATKESYKARLGNLGAYDFINEHTVLKLFRDSSTLRDAEICAVRLTKGYLPPSKFMACLDTTTPSDTVARWRFESDGTTNVCSYVRSEGFQSFNNMLLTNGKVYTNDVYRPYIRENGDLLENKYAYSADMTETPSDDNPTMNCTLYAADALYPRSITVECFFMCRDVSRGRQSILAAPNVTGANAKGVNPDGISWRLALDKGKLRYQVFTCTNGVDAINYMYTCPNVISSNEWHQAAIVCDDDTGKIDFYLDYSRVGGGTYSLPDETRITGGSSNGTRFMCAGLGFNFNNGFCGAIDEVRISRRALAPKEFIKGVKSPGFSLIYR